jgi:SCY1-like protein 1
MVLTNLLYFHMSCASAPPATKNAIETEDNQWGSVAAPVPKSATKNLNSKPVSSSSAKNEDDLWGSIAAPAPKSAAKALRPTVVNDDSDPWAAIAAPPPATRAKPLSSLGRGRGTKPFQPKLCAQRIDRTSSGSSGF